MTADLATISLLRKMNIEPTTDISLYEIGPALIARGFDQDQITNGLFSFNGKR